MKTPPHRPSGPACRSCRHPIKTHASVVTLCKKLESARTTLQIIHTWATSRDGISLNPKHTVALTAKTLSEIS